MSQNNIKNLLILFFFASLLLCFFASFSYASDFIAPNSGGEPITVDVSNLNLTSGIDVSIGDFTDQPRPYRDSNTKTLVVFPPPITNGEKTLTVRAGGSSISKTISFRPSPNGVLKNSLLPDLKQARGGNTATKISDGRVVLIGGSKGLAEDPIDTIEIFNPETGKSDFLKTPNDLKTIKLNIPRSQHSATYIGVSESPIGMISGPVEQILITGGFTKDSLLEDSIEILEIKVGTNQSNSTLLKGKNSKLRKARIFHTSTLLPDGRVLIIGGQGRISMTNFGALSSIEIFDPQAKSVLPSPVSLNTPRLLHSATTLQNGNILIAGGFTNEKQDDFGFGKATENCELINTSNLTIKKVGSLINNVGLGGHSATLLTNGFVLIIGGSTDFFSSRTQDTFKGLTVGTVQFYNPTSETFNPVTSTSGGTLVLQNPRFLHQSVLLPNGDISVIGGLNIKGASLSTSNIISSPVSTIEVIEPDLLNISNSSSLQGEQKTNIESSIGRILPTGILVTPKNKTQGFLSTSDSNNFINSALYITGGFTNGLGKLPTKISELVQIESNDTVEGRHIRNTPDAIIQGSYLSQFLIELDTFSKVPSLEVKPQTVNLSVANNFMASIKVTSTNNEIVLLKAESTDPNGSIIVSPSLFQVGESVSINRKDSSTQGIFEINIVPADSTKDFVAAKIKVNVSDSSKPFLATVPGFGISLSTQEDGSNTQKIQVKVLSQDGQSEFTSIPATTEVTATINDANIANLGGTGISSVVGTLATQFTIGAVKPGKATLNFSINFPDVLPVSIPVEINGTPTFSNTPIDTTVLSNLISSGIEISNIVRLNSNSVSLEDIRPSSNISLFPIYVPVNLQSSKDNSPLSALFTIRPIFGIDLSTALPRTLVNNSGTAFKTPFTTEPTSIGGIVPTNSSDKPIAILALSDGIRSLTYNQSTSQNLNSPLKKLSGLSDVKDLKLFEFGEVPKIVALKGSMVFVLDADTGDQETSANLTDSGFELELTNINGQTAAVVSVGLKGIDLIFPVTDASPRIVNFQLPGITKHISVIDRINNNSGPFAIAYDGTSTISIVNLIDVNASIQEIDSEGEKITKIIYAGRFTLNGKITDVLIAASERKVLLFNLNNLSSISVNEDLKIKNKIEDLLVIDGVAYVALGSDGILALSIGNLINGNKETPSEIAHFKKNKLIVIKPSGKQEIISKELNANKLANSKPFLLSSGDGNNLTVIRVSP